MSLGLQLHPIPRCKTEWFNDITRLRVSVDGWSHNVRASEHRKPIPAEYEFDYYSDDGLIHPTDCPNGEKLTWMTAGELLQVSMVTEDKEPIQLHAATKAALAYLAALDPATPVILYFH